MGKTIDDQPGKLLLSIDFRLRSMVDGKARTHTGTVTENETKVVTTFTR